MTPSTAYSDVEYVFEPHSASLPHLGSYLRSLWDRQPFMVELARAELRGPRSSTVLGSLWGILDPLFQATIYYFLYAVLRSGSASRVDFLPILVGDVFLFSLTTAAITDGGSSIRRARQLMLSSTFPRALLPLTSVYRSWLAFRPSLAVFAVLFPLLGGEMGMGLFVLPLLLVLQIGLNIGIALLVSTFVIMVRDASNLMAYVTRLLFFATPVIYPIDLLPDSVRPLLAWQPLFPLFASYQAILGGEMPDPGLVLQVAVWTVVLLVLGARVFLRHERAFALRL